MIWVVSDEAKVRIDLVRLINDRSYRSEPVDCLEDVPKRAKFRRPQLLIIDCTIKGSFDLISTMREDDFTKQVPLIMFATTDNSYHDQAIERGADSFVQKRSLDWQELLVEIERLVGPPTRRPR